MLIPVCPLVCLKALYENMLVELPFAGFFLSKLLGTSADVDIHHLASLDPEVYKNLLFLKSYEEDVEELGLNFTVVNNDLGEAQVSWAHFIPSVGRCSSYRRHHGSVLSWKRLLVGTWQPQQLKRSGSLLFSTSLQGQHALPGSPSLSKLYLLAVLKPELLISMLGSDCQTFLPSHLPVAPAAFILLGGKKA